MYAEDFMSAVPNEQVSKVAYVRIEERWLLQIIREFVVTIQKLATADEVGIFTHIFRLRIRSSFVKALLRPGTSVSLCIASKLRASARCCNVIASIEKCSRKMQSEKPIRPSALQSGEIKQVVSI